MNKSNGKLIVFQITSKLCSSIEILQFYCGAEVLPLLKICTLVAILEAWKSHLWLINMDSRQGAL